MGKNSPTDSQSNTGLVRRPGLSFFRAGTWATHSSLISKPNPTHSVVWRSLWSSFQILDFFNTLQVFIFWYHQSLPSCQEKNNRIGYFLVQKKNISNIDNINKNAPTPSPEATPLTLVLPPEYQWWPHTCFLIMESPSHSCFSKASFHTTAQPRDRHISENTGFHHPI